MVLMGGVAGSYCLVRELEQKVTNTRALCRLLRYCSEQVEYFARSAGAILSSCDVLLLRECGYRADNTPNNFFDFFESCEILCPKSRSIVLDFARDFGKNYRNEQVKHCKYYLEQMNAQEAELNAALPTQKKLACTLLLSATFMVIILLV